MRIGIFFGGQSREREISYLGGRTAYENLDRTLFEPVPIFVDSFGKFIALNPDNLHKEGIRSFYPPVLPKPYTQFDVYAESFAWENPISIYNSGLGQEIFPDMFHQYIDFALIALHGQPGEDGSLQGLLEWHGVPYSSCGILSSAIGIDKIMQTKLMNMVTKIHKRYTTISWEQWQEIDKKQCFDNIISKVGFPFVAKAPHQGSSIGVAIIKKQDDLQGFVQAVQRCFFVQEITASQWLQFTPIEKHQYLQDMTDLDKGIGFPVVVQGKTVLHPQILEAELDAYFATKPLPHLLSPTEKESKEGQNNTNLPVFANTHTNSTHSRGEATHPPHLTHTHASSVLIYSAHAEDEVLFEEFIVGQEFSCGVIQNAKGEPVALPPTEIMSAETFDFNSKYKAGGSRKRIPIDTTNENIAQIQQDVCKVFKELGFNACARIDGFLTSKNEVFLHDPNTVPGMSPASLIFKQTAEIGLNISQTLTYLIHTSLKERAKVSKNTMQYRQQAEELAEKIAEQKIEKQYLPKMAITFSTDEGLVAAKKIHAKHAAEGTHQVVLALQQGEKLYALPIDRLNKDSVAEIVMHLFAPKHSAIVSTIAQARSITAQYAGDFLQTAWEIDPNELEVIKFVG